MPHSLVTKLNNELINLFLPTPDRVATETGPPLPGREATKPAPVSPPLSAEKTPLPAGALSRGKVFADEMYIRSFNCFSAQMNHPMK